MRDVRGKLSPRARGQLLRVAIRENSSKLVVSTTAALPGRLASCGSIRAEVADHRLLCLLHGRHEGHPLVRVGPQLLAHMGLVDAVEQRSNQAAIEVAGAEQSIADRKGQVEV